MKSDWKLKFAEGDIIEMAFLGLFDVIAHGCNCKHVMGAGLAAQIKRRIPEAFWADMCTVPGNVKLGEISVATSPAFSKSWRWGVDYPLVVVNMYTQINPGPYFDEQALVSCLQRLKKLFCSRRIGLPQIGCGLGGGDWGRVQKIMEQELHDQDVTVVLYKEN